MKLSSVAKISSGVYANGISDGDVFLIQARDFDENRVIASNLKPTLSFSKNLQKHFLVPGDILVVAKGASFLSAVYDGSYSPAVASTVFMVIKIINTNLLLPEYLSWYLNLPSTQGDLMNEARGTSVPTINKAILECLHVPVPPIPKQKLILQIIHLRNQEKLLDRSIEFLKQKKINQLISNAINN